MDAVKKIQYNGQFALALEGHISSGNATQVEEAIQALIAGENPEQLVLDAKNLEYISSAGLRVILRLIKGGHQPRLVNVNPDVYEVLEITGFSEIMPVKKAFRKVSIEGCEVIGQGSNGIVYRLDPETIVKVYRNKDALAEMQREREISRKAFVLGIPTAIPYDVVSVGDQFGTVFELLNALSITKLILADPEGMEGYVDLFVSVLKQIHQTPAKPGELPDMKAVALRWADDLEGHLPGEQLQKLHRLIADVPPVNRILHGDYHSNNVMVQNGEPLMIDMDTLCIGHPVFELASTFNAYVGFGEVAPDSIERFLKLDVATAARVWQLFLRKYLNTEDEAALQAVEEKAMLLGYTRLLRRTLRRNGETEQGKRSIEHYRQRLIGLIDRVDSLAF